MPDAFVQALKGTLRDVEAISGITSGRTQVSRQLLADLRTAEMRLAATLRREAKIFGAIDERFTGAHAVVFARQAQLSTEYLQLRLRGLTEQQATKAMARSIARTSHVLERLEKRFTGIYTRSRLREAGQFDRIMNQGKTNLLRMIPTSVDRYGEALVSKIEDTLRVGMIQGMTADQMIGVLTGHGGPRGQVSMKARLTRGGTVIRLEVEDIPEGLFTRHRSWAERIVRTETIRAYNNVRGRGMEVLKRVQFPDLQKKIIAILDGRTGTDSIAVNGQVRALNDEFEDGAGRRYAYPPARPNDRETVIPWRPQWTEPAEAVKSQTERALLGELTEAEEDALIEKIKRRRQGKASGTTRKARPKPRPEAKPKAGRTPTPMSPGKKRLFDDYVGEMAWEFDNIYAGGVYRGRVAKNGSWRAKYISGQGVSDLSPQPKTHADAKRLLEQQVRLDLEKAAELTAPRFSKPRLQKAMLDGDEAEVRRQVRGVMRSHGVLPRDPARNLATANTASVAKMPFGTEAVHQKNGEIRLRKGALRQYGERLKRGDESGVHVLVHEEMHGATPYGDTGPGFYRGSAAGLEEVTVEMASRKIVAERFKKPMPKSGPYQRSIDEVSRILDEELQSKRPTADLIANAGIKMRAAGARKGPGITTGDELIEMFVDALGVRSAAKRKRVIGRLKWIRGPR